MQNLLDQLKAAKTEHGSLVLSLDLFAGDAANAPTLNKIDSVIEKIERLERTLAAREDARALRLKHVLIAA